MKVLKWIIYIVIVLAAILLIIPLFLPAVVEVTAETEVEATPEQVFHNLASYTDRDQWDPWVEMDSTNEVTIVTQVDYVGSTYEWQGEYLGKGNMIVDSVHFGKYIASSIFFREDADPSLVEWNFDPAENGTKIEWKFTSNGGYPIERIFVNLMVGGMRKSLEKGLENLKEYLEENPPKLSKLGPIEKATLPPMYAMVAGATGTMDDYPVQMADLFGKLTAELEKQGLQMAGAPFSHYLTFDEETGLSDYLCGIPVATPGRDADGIEARSYGEMSVVQAMHSGPYEEFAASYERMMGYIFENGIEVNMEAIEFYLTDPAMEPNLTKWQTLIAMPIR